MPDVAASQSTLVAQFAAQRFGHTVGDGECFALADLALRSINVKSASDFGTISANADYVWGREVTIGQAQAGDVIQFRNFGFTETTRTDITRPDGSTEWTEETRSESRPHHTAIVASVGDNGQLMVYEQNVGGQRQVLLNQLLFSADTIRSAPTTDNGVTTTITRTITVTGSAKFYRAQTR